MIAQANSQVGDFQLIFVGRPGWGSADLLEELREPPPNVQHLSGISAEVLLLLYRTCAFCIYPSAYEGFGLPAIEAFSYGKGLIASDRGSLPEIVRGLSIDPEDEDAWLRALSEWIANPHARAEYEEAISRSSPDLTWQMVASQILDQAVTLRSLNGPA